MKKNLKVKKKSPAYVFLVFLFLASIIIFLGANIFFSQNISPLFLKIQYGDYQGVVDYLKKIKKTLCFSKELAKFKKIYGEKIVSDVFSDDIKREKKIKKFEALLKLNPDSRDLLYNLYLLYKESGDDKKAKTYLQKAKTVDPWIK